MVTLYRSYRPRNFKEIVNQNHIKITLEHEIELNKIAHAYLFCGPRGIGKTTIARVFSKAVNCVNRKDGEHEPCDNCDICDEINAGRNMDIIEIDAASHTGVDNVRDNIISAARVAPSRSKYKVFIIDEVHMLSISAFNALLKILEEPPQNVIFILCTTEVHKIPATIISRCQRFDLKRISVTDIAKKLQYIAEHEKIEIGKEILEAIARRSEGHMRDAESLLGQVVVIGGNKITQKEADLVIPRSDLNEAINLIQAMINNDAGSGIAIVNNLLNEGVDLKRFLSDVIELLRKIMLSKINPALSEKLGLELGESIEVKLNNAGMSAKLPQLIMMIEKLISAKNDLKSSFIIQLPLEMAIVEICSGQQEVKSTNFNQRFANPVSPPPAPIQTALHQNIGDSANQQDSQKNKNIEAAESQKVEKNLHSQVLTEKVKISKEEILSKWNEVLVYVKKYNHSLTFILRVCEPRGIENNKLCLAFKYKFHKDRISDISIKNIIEEVLLEVYKQPILIEAIVDESIETETVGASENNVLNSPETENNSEIADKPIGDGNIGNDKNSVVEANASGKNEGDKMIDNLLKTFGGKVVG
ncbi:DNA polymerase III subunit gamma/tau [Candidatus Parcubacteria bacterium]|nr:DNA polymerase III subunit gamma/tau [Candidatus Parcubacteria bacterium]